METPSQVIRQSDLEHAKHVVFPDTSYFRSVGSSLPSPETVRHLGKQQNPSDWRNWTQPAPVVFSDSKLLVKYGLEICIAEGQCLRWLNKHMGSKVPTPEVYGWICDGDETFIYMELVEGDELEKIWPSLSEDERRSVCEQLQHSLACLRTLRQEGNSNTFIGHIGRQGVAEILFTYDVRNPWPGPFESLAAFNDYFASLTCPQPSTAQPRRDSPELAGLADDRAVVFTHNDLAKCNILVKRASADAPPQVAAIIDWHQSGWYPEDWEVVKMRWVSSPLEKDWIERWIPSILCPPDDGYWTAMEWVGTCVGW